MKNCDVKSCDPGVNTINQAKGTKLPKHWKPSWNYPINVLEYIDFPLLGR